MKILFFIESLRTGGKERRLVELLKGLRQYPEIECELVLTRKDIHYKDIFSTGIKIHYIVRKHIKKDPRLFFLFYRIAKKYSPDIIHVWGNMAAIYAIPAKVILKIPMINNKITDAPDKVNKGILSHKLTFPFSDLIIANSKAGLKSYNAPEKKSIVIYNGFNFSRVENLKSEENVREKFGIKEKYIVGMVASFSLKKDFETFLQAAKLIRKERDDIAFLCIGDGPLRESLQREYGTKNNSNRIYFLGRQENVESIMNICDIGVLATNQEVHGEGIPNALMEFMALGKPVIATDGGGTGELVINGETGFLIKPKSVEELSSKIEFLIENKDMAVDMGIKGKERIKQEFSMKQMTNKFIQIYRSICSE